MRYEAESVELINEAYRKAKELGHSYVGSVHLLLALASQRGNPGQILRDFGLDAVVTADMAVLLYGKGVAQLPMPQGLSHGAKQVLRGAAREAILLKRRQIRPTHILLSLARREKTAAGELLLLNGIDTNELFTKTIENLRWEVQKPAKPKKEGSTTKLLDQFSEDLIMKAASMEPVIAREKEIDMVIGILCRKNKYNPALVGERGVG